MRVYHAEAGDTLRKIATLYYQVRDIEGIEDQGLVERVLDKLVEKNPEFYEPIKDKDRGSVPLEPGASVVLPDVEGVAERSPAQPLNRRRNWAYVALWLLPIAGVIALSALGQAGAAALEQWLTRLFSGVQWFSPSATAKFLATILVGIANYLSPILILWTLLAGGLWLYRMPSSHDGYVQTRVRYLLWWLGGVLFLLFAAGAIAQPLTSIPIAQLSRLVTPLGLITFWTGLIGIFYIVRGDNSPSYWQYFGAYRGIWVALAIVILVTLLNDYAVYQQMHERIIAILAPRELVRLDIQSAQQATTDTRNYVNDLLTRLGEPGESAPAYSGDATLLQPRIDRDYGFVISSAATASRQANDAALALTAAIDSEQKLEATNPISSTATTTALTPLQLVISRTVESTQRMSDKALALQSAVHGLTDSSGNFNQTLVISVTAHLRQELIPVIDEANVRATLADTEIDSLARSGIPTFILTATLSAIFGLFPWVLLLMFLYRKRMDRAAKNLEDLLQLDPTGKLIERALGERGKHQESRDLIERISPHGRRKKKREREERQQQEQKDTQTDIADEQARQREAMDTATKCLAEQTFSNHEYVITLGLFTLISAVGWYFIFYPRTDLGMALLVIQRGGIREFTEYLLRDITPITAGFAGAYFFSIGMLVRRYIYADLYPSAFLQAAQRVLVVFILSLVLSIIRWDVAEQPSGAIGVVYAVWTSLPLVIAFFAGVLPSWAFSLLTRWLNSRVPVRVQDTNDELRLTKLEGMNLWTEQRFLEEKVEDIQSMATTDIEDLVVGTHYSTDQVVDWIDQSILYLHAGNQGEWLPQLRSVGIRTGTDLLGAVVHTALSCHDLRKHGFTPSDEGIEQVIHAVQDAQPPVVTSDAAQGKLQDAYKTFDEQTATIRQLAAEARSTVGPLAAAGQSLDSSAVDKLKQTLTTLSDQVAKLAEEQKAIATAVDGLGLDAEMTDSLKDSVQALAQPAQNLVQATKQAQTRVDTWPAEGPSAANVTATCNDIEQLNEDALALSNARDDLRAAIDESLGQQTLTREIVQEICEAVWVERNTEYLLNFHQEVRWRIPSISEPECVEGNGPNPGAN